LVKYKILLPNLNVGLHALMHTVKLFMQIKNKLETLIIESRNVN